MKGIGIDVHKAKLEEEQRIFKMYCERAIHMERKGIDTKIYCCGCSDGADHECNAIKSLEKVIVHLKGCCEKGYPK